MRLGAWRAAAVQSIDRALGGIIVAGAIVMPLFYTLDISDAFALPKTILVRWLALGCFGLLVVRVALRRAGTMLDPRGRAVLLAVLAYVGLNVLSYALAIDREQSWSGEPYQHRGLLSIIADAVALLAATVALSSTARVRTLFAAMTVGAVIVSLYAIVQAAGLDPVWRDLPKGRAFSTIGQANALAAYLLLALPAAIGLLAGTSRRGRAALGSAIVLIAIGLAATASRGGLLAFVVVLVVLASCLMRRPSRAAVGSAAVAAGAILLGLAIVSGSPRAQVSLATIVDRAGTTVDLDEGSIRNHLDLLACGHPDRR